MSFKRSYYPNYFSIEDIFATQERIPCKFEIPVHRLGFLDPSSDSPDIAVGATLELPFWLASTLRTHRQQTVAIEIPKIYKETYREILKADACIVDLFKLCVNFYEFGIRLTSVDHRDSPEITGMLVQTFKDRFRQILDWAQNSCTEPSQLMKLDASERELYKVGQQARDLLNAWLVEGDGGITTAEMVINHKKRRLTILQED